MYEITDKDFNDMFDELEYRDMIKYCVQVIEYFCFWSMDLVGFKYEWRNK